MNRCLVVGSYPPVPGAPAAATVAAVRRAWAEGAEVVVASPRPSAAPIVLDVAPSARGLGRRLLVIGRQSGCRRVVVCLEPGWPLSGARAERTARDLRRVMSLFEQAEVVVTGPVPDFGPVLVPLAMLWPVVRRVTAGSDELAEVLAATGAPGVTTVDPFAGAGLEPPVEGSPEGRSRSRAAVGPLEPVDWLLAARARRLAGRTARRLLGRRAPAVRAYLGGAQQRLARAVRSGVGRLRQSGG